MTKEASCSAGVSSECVPLEPPFTVADFLDGYIEFHKDYEAWLREQPNDYNLITALLKANDEVRLHSRFIFSFLNPVGVHSQGHVFAREFLASLGEGMENWLEWSRLNAYREKDQIDLCLDDGQRFVIIENKLDASDQTGQVRRYIEYVQGEREAAPEDILLVFLAKGRRHPSQKSLGGWTIGPDESGQLWVWEGSEPQARYRQCSYGTEVLGWIGRCQAHLLTVGDDGKLDSLRFAFQQYKRVVEIVSGLTTEKRMPLDAWIHEGGDAKSMRERIAHAEEIAHDLWRVKAAWFDHAMTAGIDKLLEPYINLVEPVYPKDFGILQFEQFRKEHAVAFFSPRKRCADKGRFWKVVSGSYANRVALVMCFGKSWLHVGLLPLQDGRIGDGAWAENLQSVTLRLKNHPISDKALPGLKSFGVALQQTVLQMTPFEDSEQAKVVLSILDSLFGSSSSYPEVSLECAGTA